MVLQVPVVGPGGRRRMSCYAAVFGAIAELALALGVRDLCQRDGCWAHQVDDRWWLAVNGKREPQSVVVTARGGGGEEVSVPQYSAVIYYNGWPAGIVDPFGGVLAAGEGANEDTFLAALAEAKALIR